MNFIVRGPRPESATLRAVITRADGTKEDLGIVGYWHRNLLKRLAYRLRRALGLDERTVK